jgi:tetratricopeptide (TPR) repeat protein
VAQEADDFARVRELQDEAWQYLIEYLSSNGMRLADLPKENGGKGELTIRRYFNKTSTARPFKSVSGWVAAINPIYNQIESLAATKSVSCTWQLVFGPNVTPYWARDSTALVRPRLKSDRLALAAIPLIEELGELFEAGRWHDNVWKRSELLVHLCSVLELAGKWKELPDLLDRLAKLNCKTGDFHYEADARLRQAQALFQLGELDPAADAITRGLSVIEDNTERSPPYRTKLRLLNYRAAILMRQGQNTEAFDVLARECFPLAQDYCSVSAILNVQNRLGVVNLALGLIEDAEKELTKALAGRVGLSMFTEAARTLSDLGRTSTASGQFVRAALLFEISLENHRQNNDEADLSKAALACGLAYIDLHGTPHPIAINCALNIVKGQGLYPSVLQLNEKLSRPIQIKLRHPVVTLEKAKEHLLVARYRSAGDQQVFKECEAAIARVERLFKEYEV